jgi:predicted  nucleic acid-binding Zn-ribbon protein
VDDLDRDIARMEKDDGPGPGPGRRDRSRLDAGTGPAQELEALQHELGTLARRQSELEDAELELMEQRETAQATLDQVEAAAAGDRDTRAETERRRDDRPVRTGRRPRRNDAARAPLVADLPADWSSCTRRCASRPEWGRALLRAGRCEGCRLELSGSETGRVRSADPDEVIRCEECRRILVRTAESGL